MSYGKTNQRGRNRVELQYTKEGRLLYHWSISFCTLSREKTASFVVACNLVIVTSDRTVIELPVCFAGHSVSF